MPAEEPNRTQRYNPSERAAARSSRRERALALNSSSGGSGRPFGDYLLLHELGRGCHGVVYLATREGSDKRYALKLLMSSADAESVARFHVEAQAASKIDHPGVVQVMDSGHVGKHYYYAMEFCEGENLEHRLRRGPLPEKEAAAVLCALATTLTAVHSRGVIHRDLKPGNVILQEPDGQPRITDFGLARDRSLSRLTRSGETLGTPYYMAPEQTYGTKGLDERVDVYALGVILYQCLTGELPYPGATLVEVYQKIQVGKYKPVRELSPQISPHLEAICSRAMDGDRDQRTSSAQELTAELEAYLAENAPPVQVASKAKLKLLVGAVFLLLVCVGVGVFTLKRARQARLEQAASKLAEARSAREAGDAGQGAADLLARAKVLAGGDAELEARIAAEGRALSAANSIDRFRALLIEGADEDTVEAALAGDQAVQLELEQQARLAAAEAYMAARETLGRGEAPNAATLRAAEQLAKGDPQLVRRLQVARTLGRARDLSASDQLEKARKALTEARRLDRSSRSFPEAIAAGMQDLEGREALAGARELAKQLGETKAVMARLETAEREAPDDDFKEAVRLQRITTLTRRGRFREALESSKSLWSGVGKRARHARYLVALCLMQMEFEARALELLISVEEEAPESVEGLSAVAAREIFFGDEAAALAPAQRALELDPAHVDARISLAVALQAHQRPAEALEEIERAVAEAPDHTRAYLVQGSVLEGAQDYEGALVAYTKLVQLTEPEPLNVALQRRALAAMACDNPRLAVEDLTRFLERKFDVGMLTTRGLAYQQLGDTESAVADWQSAVEIDPHTFKVSAEGVESPSVREAMLTVLATPPTPSTLQEALVAAATLARRRVGREEVHAYFDKAEAFADGDAAAISRVEVARLRYSYRRGQYANVIEKGAKLSKLAESPGREARLLVALARLLIEDVAVALAELEALWTDDPEGDHGLAAGSALLILRGNSSEGVRLADRALEANPLNVEAAINRAFGLADQGKSREATRQAMAAVRLSPDNPRAYLALHNTLLAGRDMASAWRAIEQAVLLTEPSPPTMFLRRRARLSIARQDPAARKVGLGDLDRLLRAAPQDVEGLLLRGVLHDLEGESLLAEEDWRLAHDAGAEAFERHMRGILDPSVVERIRATVESE